MKIIRIRCTSMQGNHSKSLSDLSVFIKPSASPFKKRIQEFKLYPLIQIISPSLIVRTVKARDHNITQTEVIPHILANRAKLFSMNNTC